MPAVLATGLLASSLAHAIELNDVELRGKQIYRQGSSPDNAPISAFLGVDRIKLPASAVPCGGCHGIDGRGRPEGGVVPPNITWSELSKSYGHEHDYGRNHPAFDEVSLAATIRGGKDPDNNTLDVAMPRYRMADEDIGALIAYLKRIESDFGPGVGERVITIGTLLPAVGPAEPQGAAVRVVLAAFIDEINDGGGVNGRAVELEVLPLGATPAETMDNVRVAMQSPHYLALLAPYIPGVASELAKILTASEVPIIGPLSPTPDADENRLANAYYLYAGRPELLLSLAEFAARKEGDLTTRQIVVGPDSAWLRDVASSLPVTAKRVTEVWLHAASGFPAHDTAALLTATDDVFFGGSAAELEQLIVALGPLKSYPRLFLPATAATPELMRAPPEFDGRIFVAYPTLPIDISEDGRQLFATLAERTSLPGTHFASQVSALAAAKLLLEALQRAGHVLTRERLVAELEGMSDYPTGLTPSVSFSLNRRVGARGAHIVRVDLKAGRPVPVAAWSKLP